MAITHDSQQQASTAQSPSAEALLQAIDDVCEGDADSRAAILAKAAFFDRSLSVQSAAIAATPQQAAPQHGGLVPQGGSAVTDGWSTTIQHVIERLRIRAETARLVGDDALVQFTPEIAEHYAAVLESFAASRLDAATPAPCVDSGAGGLDLIAKERRRQIEVEGWTPAHDDSHADHDMPVAAACYALPPWFDLRKHYGNSPALWPWDDSWWKPTPNDRIRELVKAGALIVAEIERLQRAALAASPSHGTGAV